MFFDNIVILAPICPFITEELWKTLYSSQSIHLQKKPLTYDCFEDFEKFTEKIVGFNSFVWNKKKESINPNTGKTVSLKDPISLSVPSELQEFQKDLQHMHNLHNINNINDN